MTSATSFGPNVVPSNLVNERNHGAVVTVTAALCIVFSLLLYLARLVVRWPWRRLLGRDDAVTAVALFFSLVQSITVSADVSAGYGKTKDDMSSHDIASVMKVQYTSDLFFIISLCLGKLAVALLFIRLADGRQAHTRVALLITLACILYGVVSFLMIAIQHPSTITPGIYHRWIAITAIGDALDLGIIIFPFILVGGLRMRKAAKVTVIVGFGARVILIPLSILRLVSLSHTLRSPDYTLRLADSEIWTQIELHYNVVAATIPCLRPFLRAFYTEQLANMVVLDEEPSISSTAATKGQSSAPLSSIIKWALSGSNKSGNEKSGSVELSTFEKTIRGYGKTETSVMRNETRNNPGEAESRKSDWSERAIVVRQTVDVRHSEL